MDGFPGLIASAPATVVAGFFSLACLIYHKRHRDSKGKAATTKIAFAVLQGATLYVLVVTMAFHWFAGIKIATTISEGFGQDRLGWLFFAMTAELMGRMFALYDPD